MLDALITSKTRLKLLLKFFLNPSKVSYLRGLATEFSESTNAIRVELNRLEGANMLVSSFEGNKKLFRVNTSHPLFSDIQSIIHKYIGLDTIVDKVLNNLGDLQEVYLVGDLADGKNSEIIDLRVVGHINPDYLESMVRRVERLINREINYVIESPDVFAVEKLPNPFVKIWG